MAGVPDIESLTIDELEGELRGRKRPLPREVITTLLSDDRKGVRRIGKREERIRLREVRERRRLRSLFAPDRDLILQGFRHIVGVDEAGRGPLAGPVTAAAVIFPHELMSGRDYIPQLDDSKRLSESQRERLYSEIRDRALAVGVAFVSAVEIDELNILRATYRAISMAVERLEVRPEFALIDGQRMEPHLGCPFRSLRDGDRRSGSIAAASIVAKVERDRVMRQWGRRYSRYGFASNKGYGTRAHLEALRSHGPCPLHRRSFLSGLDRGPQAG